MTVEGFVTDTVGSVGDAELLDALVLGGGFGGMHMLFQLRGMGLKVVALEAGDSVGGAWYWNRYPGARCDVESLAYSYSFSPVIDDEWTWTERYATQPEILRYMNFVCDRLDLRKDIRFNSRLVRAVFDEDRAIWTFTTENGDVYRARHFVSSAGPISAPIWPDIPGRETFKGELYHTALWPKQDPDFAGKRVGVIGTGSSGTQLIPLIAERAGHLTVFVRTPNYYANANNRMLTQDDQAWWKKNCADLRARMKRFEVVGSGDIFMTDEMHATRQHSGAEYSKAERRDILEQRWQFGGATMPRAFADIMTDERLNEEVCEFLRAKISGIIKDPATAEILTPRNFYFGTKRICVGTNFYETFNRPNVSAVSVKNTPIEQFTEKGLVVDGKEYELDVIICASGFDALTGALTVIDIQGIGRKKIKQAWADNSNTYLGIGVAGFPNLHMIGGPGSPSVLVNVIMGNEYQVAWISQMIKHMRDNGYTRVDVDPDHQDQWARTVKNAIEGTVFTTSDSWYVGANVKGKARGILAYAGGFANYVKACDGVADRNYEGFEFSV
jgi:cation diffusion facilitator CzcD-associated flavoprotein CzcO